MRTWIKLIAALAAIAALLWILFGIGRFTLKVVDQFGGAEGGHDPMFAAEETPEPLGSPVEQAAEEGRVFRDNSANWDVSVQTPVDQTADELAEEARGEDTDS